MTATGAEWDPEYAALAGNDLLPRLAREAFGEEYPAQLRPYGFTTWTLLEQIGRWLRLEAGETLLDLGCGEGGVGLWLAHRFDAGLIAIDFSAEALRSAVRLADLLGYGVPREYRHADFSDTTLDDASVDAAICLDSLQYAADQPAALRELRRVLRPGARFALTGPLRLDLARAGLIAVHEQEVPGWREPTRRNFELWQEHATDLRAQLGPEVAKTLLDEAEEVLAELPDRHYTLLIGERA